VVEVPEFNLIVVHEPGIENYQRVRNAVKQVLGPRVIYVYSYQSVVLYKCLDEPRVCAETVKNYGRGTGIPIIKVIPVDRVCRAEIKAVREAVREIARRIPEGSTFRVTLHGHVDREESGYLVELRSDEAVREIAEEVSRPVNLTKPDWVVYVRVVRIGFTKVAAISLLKPEELRRIQ
jgi:tRNA acetyltransferase TAN1